HMQLRKKMVGETAKWLKELQDKDVELQKLLDTAKDAVTALAMDIRNGYTTTKGLHQRTIDGIPEKAKQMIDEIAKITAERTKGGGELMNARSDNKEDYNALPDKSMRDKLKKERDALFGKFDLTYRAYNKLKKSMEEKAEDIKLCMKKFEVL